MTDPLSRFFGREAWTGRRLLQRVRKDLSDLIAVCDGQMKQTNELRALLTDLNRANIPPHWARYKLPKGTSVGQYFSDLVKRLAQLENVSTSQDYRSDIWLGGLFQPEAYITATRQAAAHAQGWSLEQVSLSLRLETSGSAEAFTITGKSIAVLKRFAADITGLKLHGARWEDKLVLNDGQVVSLGPCELAWTKDSVDKDTVNLPVYLNGDRGDVLFSANLPADVSASVVAERGLCLTAV